MTRVTPGESPRRGFAGDLWHLADLVRAAETRRSFRSKAFARAIWSLDEVDPSLQLDRDDLLAVPGIGPGVAGLIAEYRQQGFLTELSKLEREFPREAGKIRRLPRMTPRIQRDLKLRGVETRADLRFAIESAAFGDSLTGVGPLTLELWKTVLASPPSDTAIPAHEAWVTATALASHISSGTGAWVDVAGEVRRVEEWVETLTLTVATTDRPRVARFLAETSVLAGSDVGGPHITATTHSGVAVAVDVGAPEEAGTMLLIATGPPEHVATIETEGSQPTEHEVYKAAGFGWIPPPARVLPVDLGSQVVVAEEVRGDLHVHTHASPDGRLSLDEIAATALEHNYEYVLITDHTIGLRFGGLDASALHRQADEIADTRTRHPGLVMLHGAELNIDRYGELDIDEQGLELLDFAVAGLHSHFGLGRTEQTERLIAGISHPVVKVLAHPFGRRIGVRPGIEVEFDQVIDAAVGLQVALESNGHRDRLDLATPWVEKAAERGAVFAANSDAHRSPELANTTTALASLQRAGVSGDRVVNTWPTDRLLGWAAR